MKIEILKQLTYQERKKIIEEILAKKGEKINWRKVEEYRHSTQEYRELYPILVDKKTGFIVDGYHRFLATPLWNIREREIKDPELVGFLANSGRHQSKEEKIRFINSRAEKLRKEGKTEQSLTKDISELLGWSERTVRKYLEEEYKNTNMRREIAARRSANLQSSEHNSSKEEQSFPPSREKNTPQKSEEPIDPTPKIEYRCHLCHSKISKDVYNKIQKSLEEDRKKKELKKEFKRPKKKKYIECPSCFSPFFSEERYPTCPNCGEQLV